MFKYMMKSRYDLDSAEESRSATRDRSPSGSGDVVKGKKVQEPGDKGSSQDSTTKDDPSPDFPPSFALVQVFGRNSQAGDDSRAGDEKPK